MHAYAYRLESRKIGHGAKGYQQSSPSKFHPLGIGWMVLLPCF